MPRAAAKGPRKPAPEYPPLPGDAVLLALDCSSTAVGWAVFCGDRLRAAGVIAHQKRWEASRRMRHNAWAAAELIDRYSVSHVIAESQSHKSAGPRVQGLATLGKAQGYLFAVIEERFPDLWFEEVSEREWTRWGGKNLSKAKRAQVVIPMAPEYAEAIENNPHADAGMDCLDAISIALFRLGKVR